MNSNTFLLLLFCLFISLFCSNCASITGYQTARVLEEGKGEFMASINTSQSPDFDLDIDDNEEDDLESIFVPNIEVGGRFGVADKFDLGLKLNTWFNFAVDGKYQVLGDQESEVALAVGGGFGTFGLFSGLWNVQVPLYFSFHPNEQVDLYLTPRFIAQFSAGDIDSNLQYFGGNAGVLFGRRVKFGFDAGLYNIGASDDIDLESIATFGVGLKVPID